jgi:hypothetical protein
MYYTTENGICKCKDCRAIPLQALTGPEGSRRLRLPDFKTIGTWRWQGCQPYAPTAFTPWKYSWYSFLSETDDIIRTFINFAIYTLSNNNHTTALDLSFLNIPSWRHVLGFNQALDTVNFASRPTWAASSCLQQICRLVKCIHIPLSETLVERTYNIKPQSCSPQPYNYLNFSY